MQRASSSSVHLLSMRFMKIIMFCRDITIFKTKTFSKLFVEVDKRVRKGTHTLLMYDGRWEINVWYLNIDNVLF